MFDSMLAILSKHIDIDKHKHPWIRLALAEAYLSKKDDAKALEILSSLAKLYPGYLPVTMAYVEALNNNEQARLDNAIELLNREMNDESINAKDRLSSTISDSNNFSAQADDRQKDQGWKGRHNKVRS